MKKILALSSLLTIPAVAISAVSCGVSKNSSITSSNVELGMSPYATSKYLSLFETLNSDRVVNKLQKSFYEIKTSTTESKTEAEVLKWAQDTINSKTDEEIKQMVFLNAAKGSFYSHFSSSTTSSEKDDQSILYDVQDFTYDRVNSTFSFNYVINYYQSDVINYNQSVYNNFYISLNLNYRFENIKIEITTAKTQGLILPVIKIVENQPSSASVKLLDYKNEIYNSDKSNPMQVLSEKLGREATSAAFAATKQLGNSLGKTGDQLIFGSILDSYIEYREIINSGLTTDLLEADGQCLFQAYNLASYDFTETGTESNILLTEGSPSYLFGIDYIVDTQEYKKGNIVFKRMNPSKIAVANIYFIDADSTTKERTKWVAFTETQSSSDTNAKN